MNKNEQDDSPKRAALYCRVSTQEQSQKDFSSLEVQEEKCKKYCDLNEYKIVAIYKETASGGSV
ncbi:MAG: recombinase family protein, partial [Candidatus Marinimicrobia bacterium]|nr:recombinase family protein [Candidatus Neomarinimicrobiota bacterium]